MFQRSSTLTNPALEAGTGEFVGTLVTVPASNTIDSNINTLWIAEDAPHSDAYTEGTAYFQKVFFKPLAGYSLAKTWWIELRGSFPAMTVISKHPPDCSSTSTQATRGAGARRSVDWTSILSSAAPSQTLLSTRAAHRAARRSWTARLSPIQATWNQPGDGRSGTFTLDPTADWIYLRRSQDGNNGPKGTIRAAIAWNQDGSAASSMTAGTMTHRGRARRSMCRTMCVRSARVCASRSHRMARWRPITRSPI